jgi:Berberine and berberine like
LEVVDEAGMAADGSLSSGGRGQDRPPASRCTWLTLHLFRVTPKAENNPFEAIKPHAAGTAYVNFLPEDEDDRVEVAYGPNFRRLADIKRRYDPHNLFA